MTTAELLKEYNKASLDTNERPLYLILKAFENDIEGLIEQDPTGYRFHKSVRQTDVIGKYEGLIDSAIWIMLGEAKIFWELLVQKDVETIN